MLRIGRILLALGAFFVLPLALAACGGGVPGNAVANVGDNAITRDTFDRWTQIAAKSSQQGAPNARVTVPDPPSFTACVANLRKTTPPPPKGQPKVTDAALKQQCSQQYAMLRDEVLQFLISAQWIEGEAADQGVSVTDADVEKQFQQTKTQAFRKPADFDRFLKQTGFTVPDIKLRIRIAELKKKLQDKIIAGKDKVTPAQVTAYYASHKTQFATPAQRDLQVVLAKSRARAVAARAALAGGASIKGVSKRYSNDPQTKATGGVLKGVAQGQQDRTLERAAFAAPKGKLVGPVKGQFGYYVVRVTKITPLKQQPLDAKTQTSIRQQIVAQNQSKALTDFSKLFEKKWKARTDCRKDFIIQACKNAPKQSPQATTPGGVPQQGGAQVPPQGGAPQQVPPQGGTPQQVPPQQVPPQGGAPQQVPPQGGAPQQVPPQQVPPQGGAPQQVPPQGGAPQQVPPR